MLQRELARRDAIRDGIAALPVGDQAPAREAEVERQRQWEQWRAEHGQRWGNHVSPTPEASPDTEASQQSDTPGVVEANKFLRVGRWARRKMVSIPLVPLRKRLPDLHAV
jgi:hypothetical protein